MEQRCKIILQNYIYTHINNDDYNDDNNDDYNYKIDKNIIYYKNNKLFIVYDMNHYILFNISSFNRIKHYNHNVFLSYYNNKNNEIFLNNKKEKKLFKIIYNNNKDEKYYNKFLQIYKKINHFYLNDGYCMYYYSNIKLYIYKLYTDIDNIIIYNLYSKHYSIMFLFIFDYIFI